MQPGIGFRHRGLADELDPAELDQKEDYYRYHVLKYELLVVAGWLIAMEQYQSALRLLHELCKKMEEQGRIHLMIEAFMLSSMAFQKLGDHVQAMRSFDRCLVLAEPGGYVRLFLDEGPYDQACYYEEAIKSGIAVEYASKLLTAFEAESTHSGRRCACATPSRDYDAKPAGTTHGARDRAFGAARRRAFEPGDRRTFVHLFAHG